MDNTVLNTDFTGSYDRANGSTQTQAMVVHFSYESVLDGFATKSAGREIYKSVEMIEISFAGANGQTLKRKATDRDRVQYQAQFRAFKDAKDQRVIDGTDIRKWALISAAQADTLRGMNIVSVESLASLSDEIIPSLGMGGRQLVSNAKNWLKRAADEGAAVAAMAERDEMADELASMRSQMEDMKRQLSQKDMLAAAVIANGGKAVPAGMVDTLAAGYDPDRDPHPADTGLGTTDFGFAGFDDGTPEPDGGGITSEDGTDPETGEPISAGVGLTTLPPNPAPVE